MPREPYPVGEPYDEGMLDVGDGHRLYWQVSGNPDGKPAVVVHGGPGSGSGAWVRGFFDPARYRVVQFDQRGCGRSTPHASDPAAPDDGGLGHNTTAHLVADMDLLRAHLGINTWLLYGGSWGSTLLLAYAERYPERVSEIVIAAVTTTRRSETDWLYRGVGRFFPEEWEAFVAGAAAAGDAAGGAGAGAGGAGPAGGAGAGGVSADGAGGAGGVPGVGPDGEGVVQAYAWLTRHPDPAVRARATEDWCAWEDAVLSGETRGTRRIYGDRPPAARLAFVRICAHYFANGAFLAEGALIRDAGRLAGIPGVLVHGRQDMGGPLTTAWELHRAWPGSELLVVEDAGHLGTETTRDHVITALDRFAAGSEAGA